MLELLKDLIRFFNQNVYGVILLSLIIYFIYSFLHNCLIKRKYRRENTEGNINFKIARCQEEKKQDRIYLVHTKKKEITYHHIADPYTFKELGYSFKEDAVRKEGDKAEDKNDDNAYFSRKGKKLGERIKIYNIIFDIKEILGLKDEIK